LCTPAQLRWSGRVTRARQHHRHAGQYTFAVARFVSGIGNGSTYKMIPAIFRSLYPGAEHEARRLSGAVIGIAGASARSAACW
jgi:NNP family nitrate/nitrite transporter-like MFS transporter